jgi:hypothetical protein
VDVYVYAIGDRGQYAVEIQIDACLCTDRDNPGDTQTWADTAYISPPARYSDAARADREAKRLAGEHAAGRTHPASWDGRGPWGR